MVSRSAVATNCSGGSGVAVERQRGQVEAVAIEHQRRRGGAAGRERERRAHPRGGRVEADVEIDGLDQPVRRAIVLETDGAGLFGAHGALLGCGGRDVFTHIPRIGILL